MSVTTDLLAGIAGMITAGVTGTAWDPAGVYQAGQTGIFLKLMPTAPDRVITLTAVSQGDNPSMPLGQVMIQVRGRGLPNRPTDVDDLLDACFDVLHGTTDLVFGATTVVQMNRRVSAPMGMDEASKRWERVDQYYLDVDYPPTVLRPVQGSW